MKYRLFLPAIHDVEGAREEKTLAFLIAASPEAALSTFFAEASLDWGSAGAECRFRVGDHSFLRKDAQAEEAKVAAENIDRAVLVGAQLAREAFAAAWDVALEVTTQDGQATARTRDVADMIFHHVFEHASRTTTTR